MAHTPISIKLHLLDALHYNPRITFAGFMRIMGGYYSEPIYRSIYLATMNEIDNAATKKLLMMPNELIALNIRIMIRIHLIADADISVDELKKLVLDNHANLDNLFMECYNQVQRELGINH